MKQLETTIINQLFLELSQVATARTNREIELLAALENVVDYWDNPGGFDACVEVVRSTRAAIAKARGSTTWCMD